MSLLETKIMNKIEQDNELPKTMHQITVNHQY